MGDVLSIHTKSMYGYSNHIIKQQLLLFDYMVEQICTVKIWDVYVGDITIN